MNADRKLKKSVTHTERRYRYHDLGNKRAIKSIKVITMVKTNIDWKQTSSKKK